LRLLLRGWRVKRAARGPAARACDDVLVAIEVTYYSDPGCPWAYSACPAHAVLRWRYGDQLSWRLVTIGLTERAEQYVERGYTPSRSARAYLRFRRYGMPFSTEPRKRVVATARACRAIVATRLTFPGREFEVFRALQFAWFTTPLLLDEDDQIAIALRRVPDLDIAAVVACLDDSEVVEAYESDRKEARNAAGTPTEFQGKAARTDGPVRYTAPSVVFRRGDVRLEAGGFQTTEAYDVLVANLDSTLERAPSPDDPFVVLQRFREGLTTQEVAAVMAQGNDVPDRARAEAALIELVDAGRAIRTPLADDALWTHGLLPSASAEERAIALAPEPGA
jgi:2-hydroxychromene-2-carboxylate isomerase